MAAGSPVQTAYCWGSEASGLAALFSSPSALSILITVPFFKLKAPSCVCFMICFISPYLRLLSSRPSSCSWGFKLIHVVCVVLHCELHVPSCERALPEDGASSTDTVSSHNFSKALLSPSEKPFGSCERFNSVLSPPPPFLLKTFCFTELFPVSPCVISSFSMQTPPPLLANICVVRGGEILEPLVYFRIKKTSFLPTLLPSYVHSLSSLQHTHMHTALSVLSKVLPGKSLP